MPGGKERDGPDGGGARETEWPGGTTGGVRGSGRREDGARRGDAGSSAGRRGRNQAGGGGGRRSREPGQPRGADEREPGPRWPSGDGQRSGGPGAGSARRGGDGPPSSGGGPGHPGPSGAESRVSAGAEGTEGIDLEAERHKAFTIRNLRTFTSLKYPAYRLFYASMLGQMASMNIQMFVRALLVFRLTESPGAVGLMALANAGPILFFSLFGGVFAERVQKRYILVAGLGASAIVTAGVVAALVTGLLHSGTWWILIVASLLQGLVMSLMMPARQAVISELVPSEHLMNAVALNTLGMNGLRLTAPAIAGVLVDFFGTGEGASGFASVYIVMTGLYIVATLFAMAMPPTGHVPIKGRGAMGDIMDGFRYVRRDHTILVLLLVTLVVTMFSMPYMFLLPVFTEMVLNVSAGYLGLLVSASGAGAMAGSLVLASLPNKKRGLLLILGSLLLGVALTAFSFSNVYYLSLAIIVFVGVGQTTRMTLGNTLLQYYVQEQYRGRVMSMMMMEFGVMSFVAALVGLIAEFVGVQIAVGSFAIALVVISVGWLLFLPSLRRLE